MTGERAYFDPPPVELLFYRGTSFVSRAIQKQTRSVYSHVALKRGVEVLEAWHEPMFDPWWDPRPKGRVVLSEGAGAPWSVHTDDARIDVYRIPALEDGLEFGCTGCDRSERAWDWAVTQIGKRYDFAMVWKFIPRGRETDRSKDRWFCSELAAMAFTVAGYPLLERIPPSETSPGELVRSPLLSYCYTMTGTKDGHHLTVTTDHVLASEDRQHAKHE